ncbi:MFS transporter [Amycolatopsis thermophila]|uniref:Metabolite-proton symporter n=1 Tax=Amycolatopsis thermophila TaxID=206084 RepID=A0ABU0F1D2_9PSEU|nr:MFS transporter [Amycolatopsis thermophila]MDQ0381159.1 metabolite-proton symporter [Amycolatopsis thermophila]
MSLEVVMVVDQQQAVRVRPARVAFASFLGTAIEWYDFFLFGSAATLVFNTRFFPTLSPLAGTLAAFATFGVAFVARPLGGIVFGHFGDRLGRKRMLILSLLLMGGGTVAIGLLPDYARIGAAAPILLVLVRLLQGFAVGGEWGGAVLMAVEHAPPHRRAFYGSWPQAGVPAGLVLSASAFLAVQQLPKDQLLSWGWRLPFLASAVLIVVGLYVRSRLEESPEFQEVTEAREVSKFPLKDTLRRSLRAVLVGLFAQAASNIPFYVVSVFVLSYAPGAAGVSRGTVLTCLIVASLVDIAAVPLVAVLADRIGNRKVLLIGALYSALAAFPFFHLIDTGAPLAVLVAMFLFATLGHALTYSAMAGFLAELFGAEHRYTGVSVAYQVGGLITSGPAPFIAAALFAGFGGSWVIALYIVVACVVTFVALLLAPRRA